MKYVLNMQLDPDGAFSAVADSIGLSDETAISVLEHGSTAPLYGVAMSAMNRSAERLANSIPAGSC